MSAAYTLKETEFAVETYLKNPNWDTVLHIAAKLRRTPRSVVAKLSKEGVYSKDGYTDKLGRRPVTKLQLVRDLEGYLDVSLLDLDKAPKETLRKLRDYVFDLQQNYETALKELAEYNENAELFSSMRATRAKVQSQEENADS
jgi:hypothetical protein